MSLVLQRILVELLLNFFDAGSNGIDSNFLQHPINLCLSRHDAIHRLCRLLQLCLLRIRHATTTATARLKPLLGRSDIHR